MAVYCREVVVLSPVRVKDFDILHSTHPGIQETRMKGLAHSYVWWPGMDPTTADQIKGCVNSQEFQKSP